MGVAAENDRYALLTAETQNLNVVRTRLELAARGYEAAVVDFEQSARLASSLDYRGEVELGSTVARVADDLSPRIAYGLNHAVGVLLARTSFPTQDMYAGYPQIEQLVVILVEIEMTLGVEYVELCTEHQPHTLKLSGHDVNVAEIYRVARPRYARGMLRDAKYVQPQVGSLVYHLLQGAESMSAHDGMRVDIESWSNHASALGVGIS